MADSEVCKRCGGPIPQGSEGALWCSLGCAAQPPDPVNPKHYKQHPSGVECIDVVEHMGFNLGNAVKYVWRAGLKSESPIEDLKKARWYLDREIARIEKASSR